MEVAITFFSHDYIGKSRDLKTKSSKTGAAYIILSVEQKPKGRLHSDAQTDVWIC